MQSATNVLKLYRNLLREASRFDHYNFREYFLRQTRTGFREQRKIADNSEAYAEAQKNLAMLKRQAAISNMYHFDKLVVEKLDKKHTGNV